MKLKIIAVTLKPKTKRPDPNRQMEDRARKLAYECSEDAWDGLLWATGLEAASALHRAMQVLADDGDYTGAFAILKGVYALGSQEMPPEAAAYEHCPEILELFMDEFLAESEEYLDECADDQDKGYFEMDDLSN